MSKNNKKTVQKITEQFIGKCNECGKTTKLNVPLKMNKGPEFCSMCGAAITYQKNNLLTENKEV